MLAMAQSEKVSRRCQHQADSRRAPMSILRELAPLLQRVEAVYHPVEIWLFGSRARGEAHSLSDWDLNLQPARISVMRSLRTRMVSTIAKAVWEPITSARDRACRKISVLSVDHREPRPTFVDVIEKSDHSTRFREFLAAPVSDDQLEIGSMVQNVADGPVHVVNCNAAIV